MAGSGSSMLYSFLLCIIVLSLQQMYRGKLASSELFTIIGGFTSSLIFLPLLTFIGNLQETYGQKTGWGAVIAPHCYGFPFDAVLLAECFSLVAASTIHRVCISTCFLFSMVLLYEINKLSFTMVAAKNESKTKRH